MVDKGGGDKKGGKRTVTLQGVAGPKRGGECMMPAGYHLLKALFSNPWRGFVDDGLGG